MVRPMEKILRVRKEYNQIIVYRHVNPDLDAFGSQIGLYWTLKTLFPKKNIVLAGKMESDLLRMFPKFKIEEIQKTSTLGIVLDTANRERIDGDISLCDKIVKIDHHIVVDSYGDINIEDEKASSCSEIVALLLKETQMTLPIEAAKALYLGIVGDSNRFLYQSTSQKTFAAASYLLDAGINIESIYQELYVRSLKDMNVTKFIYNHFQINQGVAWYYLSQKDLDELNITREQGSNYVNTLANYDEIKIWMAVTENTVDQNYRVSIRSRGIAINDIASEFRGGGHIYASGATLESLDELESLVLKLKEKVNG